MEILIAVFGFFLVLSAVALVKYSGNPLFIFSFLLCSASLIWLVRLNLEDSRTGRPKTARTKRRARRR